MENWHCKSLKILENNMGEEKKPQFARVEQPFGCEFPVVHCPICGKATTKLEDGISDPNYTPCEHFAFIYLGVVGEFVYSTEDFNKRIEKIDDEEIDFDEFEKFLQKAGYDNKLLSIELTHGGMACGPVWYTDIFAFDYGILAKNDN